MSLYYEAATLLTNADRTGGSLKSRIHGKKDLKSAPAQVFALIIEATKWSSVLKDVIERAGLLKEERKLTPTLALLLTYDLLLAKNGVAAPANHPLKVAVSRHRARLGAELTRKRLQLGLSSVEELRSYVQTSKAADNGDNGAEELYAHPRWVRLNMLKTKLQNELQDTFAEFKQVSSLKEVMRGSPTALQYYTDPTIDNLIAIPSGHVLSTWQSYSSGKLILQDKASCFPAALLDLASTDGDVIDATAAPGNKTTHLAALLDAHQRQQGTKGRRVFAFERDGPRFRILQKMIKTAGADVLVDVKHQDFLTTDPYSEELQGVTSILLDPSCSGSGIVGRDDAHKLALPEAVANGTAAPLGKKRKRLPPHSSAGIPSSSSDQDTEITEQPEVSMADGDGVALKARLAALSSFQLKTLLHAMAFPSCRRITYSTCSIHASENEDVVLKALNQSLETGSGWRILTRDMQIAGLRDWPLRGDSKHCDDEEVVEACIRCEKGTEHGTMGFFVAGFVRDLPKAGTVNGSGKAELEETEEEWDGFDD